MAPPILRHAFTTAGTDLDRTGQVAPWTWLRYFEDLRWAAAAEGDLGLMRLLESDVRLVVRVQKLEVLGAVGRGEALVGSLWVSRVGRTSFDLAHLVDGAAGGEVARGSVTVVCVGADLAPTPVPDFLRGLVRDDERSPRVSALPPSTRRPPGTFARPVQVRPSDLDFLQHVNQAVYAAYFDDLRVLALEAGAYGVNRFATYPLRGLAIEYAREVKLGDALVAHTWAVANEPDTFAFELERAGDDRPVARALFKAREP